MFIFNIDDIIKKIKLINNRESIYGNIKNVRLK
jgi:hypothetical protein